MKKITKKQWGMVAAAILLLGTGGSYVYAQAQSNKKNAEVKEELILSTNNLKDNFTKMNELLDKNDPNFLVKDVKEDSIKTLKKNVLKEVEFLEGMKLDKNKYSTYFKESEKVQNLMNKVDLAYKTQVGLNKLYQKTAINGSDVKKDLAIADDLKSETVEKAKKEFFKEGATSAYDKTINMLIANAEDQLNQISTAKAAVATVFKDNKIISTDKKLYDSAKVETEKIKNEKAKKPLLDQLSKVKTELDKKAKETEEQQAATQTAQNQTPTTTTDQAAVNATNSQNTNGYNDQAADQSANYDNGTGGYTPAAPANNDAGYQAPANAPAENNTNQAANPAPAPSTGGNGQGVMTQDEGNKAAEDASNMDPTTDPNSPWHK